MLVVYNMVTGNFPESPPKAGFLAPVIHNPVTATEF